MPGKSVSPEVVAEAVMMRAAGFTAAAISARLGVAVRTLHRIFAHHKTAKGAVTVELLEAARHDLIDSVFNKDMIKAEAAGIAADDLAHARLLRERVAAAYELLQPTNLEEAAICMRAAAAAATTLKVTGDTLRRSLRTDRAFEQQEADDLPVLEIHVITPEQALEMRQRNAVGFELPPPPPDAADGSEARIDAPEGHGEGNDDDDVVIEGGGAPA